MASEKKYLQSFLAGESRAYGFTIAFWGSGAMLINAHGIPNVWMALLYGLGAVTGFGILAVAAFGRAKAEVEYEDPRYIVLGMIHYFASLVPIALAAGITALNFPEPFAYFLSGLAVSTTYNILLVLEEDIVEILGRFSLA